MTYIKPFFLFLLLCTTPLFADAQHLTDHGSQPTTSESISASTTDTSSSYDSDDEDVDIDDDDPDETLTYRTIKFSGKFHPIAVHFPIAFLLGAALMQWLFVFTKKSQIPPIVTTMLWFGTLGSILAATLGWAYAYDSMYFGEEDNQLLFLHRWIGTSTAAAAVIAVALKHLVPKTFTKPLILALLLTAVAALVGAAGHYGGSLTYGADNFTDF